jgi:PAS domain S-box-containing protein
MLRRSVSQSDLNLSTVAFHEHGAHIKAPRTFRTCPDEDSATSLESDFPAPARFERANRKIELSSEDLKGLDSLAAASALISMRTPHEIISVNEKILRLLGYQDCELIGRSMRILYTPSTDPMVLKGAIKSIAANQIETLETTIHDKAGQGHLVNMMCSPWTKEGSGSVLACLLQIEEIKIPSRKELSFKPTPSTSNAAKSFLRKSSRHSYNFRIGLELHQN